MGNSNDSASFGLHESGKKPASETTTVDFDQPASLVGQLLDGRFLIEKNLTDGGAETGGIGVVYLAQDTKLMGKDVVVKILNETALKHPDIVRKFLHEKEALIRLDHPNIVRILDSGTLVDGNPFMVMDFIEGHSLRRALQLAGKLPLEVVADIIAKVTDALSAAHAEKILHRDIKPENIMLTPIEEGLYRVRLIDFGIARVEESKLAPATEISRAIGTVLYIAPEQLIGHLNPTPASDIYSTAIVAYEMLTGETPFKPKSIAEMYQLERDGVQTRPSELRADMPREAERILLTALEFDPEKRPQNARAFGRCFAKELRIDGRETDRFFASVQTELSKSPTEVMPSADSAEFPTVRRAVSGISGFSFSGFFKWAILSVIGLAIITIIGGYFLTDAFRPKNRDKTETTNTAASDNRPERTLSYFLTVQKMRNKKPFEAPFKSSGMEIFESGYKFTMNFEAESDGFMYIFAEDKNAQNEKFYNLLFPTPRINNGSSQISIGKQIETLPNTFRSGRGTEVIWLIWTKDSRSDLEAVLSSAMNSKGVVDDPSALSMLLKFVDEYKAETSIATKDSAKKQTVVKARGDVILHRFELEHR